METYVLDQNVKRTQNVYIFAWKTFLAKKYLCTESSNGATWNPLMVRLGPKNVVDVVLPDMISVWIRVKPMMSGC